jgi:hypothetical protein
MAPDIIALAAIADALRARYPGVRVTIGWVDRDKSYPTPPAVPQYKGWRIDFRASKFETLVRYGIATDRELAACFANADTFDTTDEFGHNRYVRCEWPRGAAGPPESFTVGVHVPDLIPEGDRRERRVRTKKMQCQVAKLLKRAFALARKAELP